MTKRDAWPSEVPTPEEASAQRLKESHACLSKVWDYMRAAGLPGLAEDVTKVRAHLDDLSTSYRQCCEAHDALAEEG